MAFLDAFFPRRCLGCGQAGNYFCPACLPLLKKVVQICPVCEQPSLFGQTHPRCSSHLVLAGVISLFAYGGMIKKAIHQLKYRLVTDLLTELWEITAQELKGRAEELSAFHLFIQKKPVVMPVPLFWYKENLRGFNQSNLIGKKLADSYNLAFSSNFLIRQKMTPSQTQLDPKERRKNVADAFKTNPNFPLPASDLGLLIDDVWTTGATLKAATQTLKKAGFREVWGLTLAR